MQRSAFITSEVLLTIFWSRWSICNSEETACMTFKRISEVCMRLRISSLSMAFWTVIAALLAKAASRASSSGVKTPSRLLSTWRTPRIFPSLLCMGIQRMVRV